MHFNKISIGIKAINTVPIKSVKNNIGDYSKNLNFASVDFKEGEYIYSDSDGIIVLEKPLINDTEDINEGLVPFKIITFTKFY